MAAEMEWLVQTLAVTGFFLLRVGVPLLVVAAIALWLRRLDRRWQAEAERERRRALEVTPAFVPQLVAGLRCYEQRQCSAEKRSHCPALQQPNTPCWLSRLAAEGSLPTTCPSCGIYRLRAGQPAAASAVAEGARDATTAA